ncbi:hypothetical protein ACTXT7_004738 [Hymenolepis weldensis]
MDIDPERWFSLFAITREELILMVNENPCRWSADLSAITDEHFEIDNEATVVFQFEPDEVTSCTQYLEIKPDTTERTRHMKLKAEELKQLYVGYQQLSFARLNRYDEANPPPVPYTFTDPINTTSRVPIQTFKCTKKAKSQSPKAVSVDSQDEEGEASYNKVLPTI